MKIKLIIFDLFGTLISSRVKLKPEEFFAFYQKLGIQLKTKEDIKSFTSIFTQLMAESTNWRDLSQKLLKKVLPEYGPKKVNELASFYQENLVYQPYDDTKEIINLPHQKAILTTAAQFLFSNLGFEKYFKIFTPKETKFLKPDPRAFLAVLEKLKIKPEEALMVGDELERDLIPAKKLGIETALIDRDDKIKDSSIKKISSLKELKNLLV